MTLLFARIQSLPKGKAASMLGHLLLPESARMIPGLPHALGACHPFTSAVPVLVKLPPMSAHSPNRMLNLIPGPPNVVHTSQTINLRVTLIRTMGAILKRDTPTMANSTPSQRPTQRPTPPSAVVRVQRRGEGRGGRAAGYIQGSHTCFYTLNRR